MAALVHQDNIDCFHYTITDPHVRNELVSVYIEVEDYFTAMEGLLTKCRYLEGLIGAKIN